MIEIPAPTPIDRIIGRELETLGGSARRGYPRWIIDWCERLDTDVADPPREQAVDVFWDMTSDVAPGTRKYARAILRWFYSKLIEHGATTNGVVWTLELGKAGSDPRPGYPQRDLDKLIAHAAPVDLVVILLHTDANVRAQEAADLLWADVIGHHAIRTKGGDVRLTPRLDRAIHALPYDRGPLLPFGTSQAAYERIKRLCCAVGVESRGLDVLRRYYS